MSCIRGSSLENCMDSYIVAKGSSERKRIKLHGANRFSANCLIERYQWVVLFFFFFIRWKGELEDRYTECVCVDLMEGEQYKHRFVYNTFKKKSHWNQLTKMGTVSFFFFSFYCFAFDFSVFEMHRFDWIEGKLSKEHYRGNTATVYGVDNLHFKLRQLSRS